MNFDYRTLFVGDLPNYCHEGDLQMLFSSFGPVVDVKIHSGDDNGRSSSYAFVTLTNFAAIEAARKHLDGFIFMGRKLKIRRATLSSRGPDTDQTPQQVNSLYIRFTSPVIDRSITEFDLHRIFAPFGLVEDVSIKESSINHHNHVQYGYGFVHFAAEGEGMRAAFQAVSALDRSTVQGITLHVELSRNLLRQFNRMNGGGDVARGGYGNESPAYQRPMDMPTPSYHSFSPSYSSPALSRNGSGALSGRSSGGYNVEPPFPPSIPSSGQIPYHQPPFRGAAFSSGYMDGSSPNLSHMPRRRPQDFGADRFHVREGLEDALQGLSLNSPNLSYLPNSSSMAPVGMPLPLSQQQRQTLVDGSSVGSLSTYQPLWDNMEMKHSSPPLVGPSPDPWLPFEPSVKGSEGQDNSITSHASGSSLRFPSSGDDFPKHSI